MSSEPSDTQVTRRLLRPGSPVLLVPGLKENDGLDGENLILVEDFPLELEDSGREDRGIGRYLLG